MFDKLAEDIEKRYWQKLAALEKDAGLQQELALRDAMARTRGGKLPTIKEVLKKLNKGEIEQQKGYETNWAVDGEEIHDLSEKIFKKIQDYRKKPSADLLSELNKKNYSTLTDEEKRIWSNSRSNDLREAIRKLTDKGIDLVSNVEGISDKTTGKVKDTAAVNTSEHLRRSIPFKNSFNGRSLYDIPEEDINELEKAVKKYVDHYFNNINPTSKKFNYKNVGTGRHYYMDNALDYSPLSRHINIVGQPAPDGHIALGRDLLNLPATNDNYKFVNHPGALSKKQFSKIYQTIVDNKLDNIKPQLPEKVVLNESDLNNIKGMSLQKAVDRYGGSLDNAIFKGGDTGEGGSINKPDPEAAAFKVKPTAAAPSGGRDMNNVLEEMNTKQHEPDRYYNSNNRQMFFSPIPQQSLHYALNQHNGLQAVPWGIGNGKLIRALAHTDAIDTAARKKFEYLPQTIDNLTKSHGHWATDNLDLINSRFEEAQQKGVPIENINKGTYGGNWRNATDPSWSRWYEHQLPSSAVNYPGAYTRGTLIGKDLNYRSWGNPDDLPIQPENPDNPYKQQFKQVIDQKPRDFIFLPAGQDIKALNAYINGGYPDTRDMKVLEALTDEGLLHNFYQDRLSDITKLNPFWYTEKGIQLLESLLKGNPSLTRGKLKANKPQMVVQNASGNQTPFNGEDIYDLLATYGNIDW